MIYSHLLVWENSNQMQVKLLPFLLIAIGNCKQFIPFYINQLYNYIYEIDEAGMFLPIHSFLVKMVWGYTERLIVSFCCSAPSGNFRNFSVYIVITDHWKKSIVRVKVFKNGPSKICGRQCLKNMKWYGLPQILLRPFLNTLFHFVISLKIA